MSAELEAGGSGAAPLLGCGCRDFCENHGRHEIVTDANGQEWCGACADDGFTGELCTPAPDSCSSRDWDEWHREFMCATHAAEHLAFCAEEYDPPNAYWTDSKTADTSPQDANDEAKPLKSQEATGLVRTKK